MREDVCVGVEGTEGYVCEMHTSASDLIYMLNHQVVTIRGVGAAVQLLILYLRLSCGNGKKRENAPIYLQEDSAQKGCKWEF